MARIVFDLDGTLVHSNPTLTAAGNALLAELDRGPVSDAITATFVGRGARVLVERLLRHTGGVPGNDLTPHHARFRDIYAADPLSGTAVYAGVGQALADLDAAGHGLGVCTQKPNLPALAILHGLALMPPIVGFAGGDSLDVLKPDPRMLHHAADQLASGQIIFVGDSDVDAATAQAAGVPFLLHTEGYRHGPIAALPHAAAFADFAELPGLIAGLIEAHTTA